jgi:hypothetical protein
MEHEDLFGSLHESIAAEADRHLTVMLDLGDDEVERYVRSVIASFDVVLGTFSDPSHPEGIGALLIKGREITHVMRETRRMPAGLSVTAIPCQTRELVVAALMMWGDGKP